MSYTNNGSLLVAVDGVQIPVCPSEYSWGLSDVSDSDAGRVQDGNDTMFKNRTSQKRKLTLGWQALQPEDTAKILQMFNPEYVNVTYFDSMSGGIETREFYVGDRSASVKQWFVGGRLYDKISFNIIER